MSVQLVDQDNGNEQHNQLSETNDEDERWLRYKKLVEREIISKEYIKDGTKMQLKLDEMEDADWLFLLREVNSKDQPLRQLKLGWKRSDHNNKSIEPRFIELTNAIQAHTTLVKFTLTMNSISSDNKLILLLETLKNNRFIKHLLVNSSEFDLETARALSQMLINNQTLVSLNLDVVAAIDEEYNCSPITSECVVELGHSLQTTILQRLRIGRIANQDLKTLLQSLPKTLVYLDFTRNDIEKENIPVLLSYLNSNGETLKELILDDDLAAQYFQQQESSASSATVKIMQSSSLEAKVSRKNESLSLGTLNLKDADWPLLVTKLTKDDTKFRELRLSFPDDFNRNHLNYLETILGKQCRLTSLSILDYGLDPSIQTEVFRMLKKNNSINKLKIFGTDSKVLNELENLLEKNKNIIHLHLCFDRDISGKEVIMLANCLKNNQVLQSLIIDFSQIDNIGFETLLSSLPNSLSRLELNDTLITAKCLPSLLAFVKTPSNLKKISLQENGISWNDSMELNVPDLVEQILKVTNEKHCILKLDINEKIKEKMAELTNGNINLHNAKLRDDHILELCNQLKKKPNQNWTLDLSWNDRISSIGYLHLVGILSSTISIGELSLGENRMNEETRTILFDGLQNNKTLNKFNIHNNILNNQDMEYLGRFIQNNSALTELNFNRCNINVNGIVNLVKGLPQSSLELLCLHYNPLGDRGLAILLSSIPSTLWKLSINNNEITESSLETILTFLSTNRTLKILEMHNNPIFGGDENADRHNNTCWQKITEATKQNGICELA